LNKILKYTFLTLLLAVGVLSLFSGTAVGTGEEYFILEEQQTPVQDTPTVRYPVKRTQVSTYEDLEKKPPIDLRDPSNVKTEIEYDLKNNVYLFKSKIDDKEWVTPFTLDQEQYNDYTLKQSMSEYFKMKNAEIFDKGSSTEDYSLKDIKINIGPAEKIFGPGGIRFKPQGYVELSMGMRHQTIDNPTLSQKARSSTIFNFDEKIQLNVNASVGDKVSFDLNYDTEATFDFDSKKIKLAYEGKEDEIVRYIEAGNVSLNTTNSLINGASSLFGIRADLQFGKLKINTVISQQESESQSVSSKGGVQSMPFEFKADTYDENRHFFLARYFRDNYDKAMSKLPYVQSPVIITNLEVWVTNKRGNPDDARGIVAFADLAEHYTIKNDRWRPIDTISVPYNKNNTLYDEINTTYKAARNFYQVTQTFEGVIESGLDYEKLENARKLSTSEYTFNNQLGYISLNYTLQPDEVLAVAYEYTIAGKTYKVGEFGKDIVTPYIEGNSKSGTLFLKLLKPVSLSPNAYTWDLMMKNIYSLGAYQLQSDKFRLNISYQNDTTGTYVNYISEGNIKNVPLLRVMNLDRLDARNNAHPDGIFDFLEGYTVTASNGRIIFPVVEPFGKHLKKAIADTAIANRYVYQELYDSTLTVARQVAERNKFKIYGTYKASNNNEIYLNATNVARGSVKVMAGGMLLTEGTDYTVDYMSGIVRIVNQSIIDAGTSVSVSLENQSFFSMQRKTLLGLNLSYEFSKDFNIGATIMHMYEKPLTMKTEVGGESVKNTLWGFNTSYRTQSQFLTDLVDKLPFVTATAPSQIALNAEFAQMMPGHYQSKYGGGYSYLDDFESSRSRMSFITSYGWSLASIPYENSTDALFEEAKGTGPSTGKNRAHLAWFNIDNMFTRRNSSLTPAHIKGDKNQLSNHFVREINVSELYPNRETLYNETATLPTFNLSFYPEQRGMYNVDFNNMSNEGKLLYPKTRWGGIAHKITAKDFEANNYEYIEFWMIDPFVYNDTARVPNTGGELYFNLGEISEDILKDGRKFYENGLPVNGDPSQIDSTDWGRVPKRQSIVYAFDNQQDNAIRIQDVGLNGLSTEQEKTFHTYRDYVEGVKLRVTDPIARARFDSDPFSPLNDPGGDNYHYYRGADYDRDEVSILDRYKYYNGTEGNSVSTDNNNTNTARSVPDVEDMDQDYTMNETEAYYQYKVVLKEDSMVVGKNYISEARTVKVRLENGNEEEVTWYQFKIPIREGYKKIGNIQDFKSIRYMRMFMHGFEHTTFLRFGSLDLVRGDWRTYTQTLNTDPTKQDGGIINVSSVNIEENGDKKPVNYIIPPGVTRILDPSQPQLRQENEQALSFQILDLEKDASRAVYKNTAFDLRRFKRLQMFTHAEELVDGNNELKKGELTVFLRLGSDYKNNYYEYEIPLSITPPAPANGYNGNNYADQLIVWPEENTFDFPLELLKNVKVNRNREKRKAGSKVSYTEPYPEQDPDKPMNKVTVMGNPSLSDINVIMIGVRNNYVENRSAEIWVNELRVTDFDEEGGWAAQGSLNVSLSDIGSVNLMGRKETAGFGSIEQSLMERRMDDYHTYSVATNVDLGRFLPEKAKVTIPLYYSYSNETTTPKYDPLDQDVTLKESMSAVSTKAEKDSIKNLAQDKTISKNFSLSGVKVNIKSKTPMPYDPANFTFGYSQKSIETKSPTIAYDQTKENAASLTYSYSPLTKTWKPFKDVKSKAPMGRYAKSIGFNYLPSNITFSSYLNRYYTETLIRDLESYTLGEDNSENQFLSWSSSFYWDRNFSLSWDFTKNLKGSIQTGTKAEIYEPYLQVNKKLNPGDYELWKDTVMQSLKDLGTPLSYNQTARLTYTLPFSDISFLDWANSTANYESSYRWDRGASIDEETQVGNTIANSITFGLNNRFNLLTLYNKSPFLRKVNQKFGTSNSRTPQRPVRQETRKPKKFEQEITLKDDTTTTVKHNLNTKNLRVSAKRVDDGKVYPLKFKKTDNNTIQISTKDSVKVKLSVLQGPDPEENIWYKVAQYSARGLMSVRNVSINYSRRKENYIYGFLPNVGDAFGQNQTDYGMAPGLGFAFGFKDGEDFVDESLDKKWLISDGDMNISPAVFNSMEKIDIKAQLEPIRGLKIDLTALRETNERTEYQFMYENKPKTFGGSFTITTISLGSAFESTNANNDYQSATFDKFLSYRSKIANRLENKYNGTQYPNSGFLNGHPASNVGNANGGVYDPTTYGGVNQNSADVLIPAFLAAYTGKDPDKISLSPFPSLSSLVPNWSVTYDGLTTIPWFKEKFKSVRLMHGYTSQYRVGSYQSHSSWVGMNNDMGFIEDLDGNPSPSSPYNISSVSIVEQFNPLFGAEGTLNNSMTLRARYNTQRTLNLNITSYQIVESRQKEFVLGMGYTINEFNRIIGLSSKSQKGFSNDLKLSGDLSYKSVHSLLRKIEERFSQATAGSTILTIKLSADYALSKALTLRGFFDRAVNKPLVSATAYPTTNTNFGVSIRFTLTQ